MAEINFEPTWISVFRDEELERNSEPIEVAGLGGDPYRAQSAIGFDAEKILDFINHSETPALVYLSFDVIDYITTYISINQFTGEETSLTSSWVGVSAGVRIGQWDNQVSLNELHVNGEDITFKQALESGYTGLGFRKSGTIAPGIGQFENFTFVLEGEWNMDTPSNLQPRGGENQNQSEPIVLSWQYNGSFDQREFELRYRPTGESDWIVISEESSSHAYTIPSGELSIGEYEWQVRTVSNYDYESSWSSINIFNVAVTTPAPSIIEPATGSTVPVSDLSIVWESEEQDEYEAEVLDRAGNEVWSGSGGSATSLEIEDLLTNGETYILRLRVNADNGIFSNWVESTFDVEYTAPENPVVSFTQDDKKGFIHLDIQNPEPSGTYPVVTHQHLYRRRKGESAWIKLADSMNGNDQYIDFTLAGNTEYEYRLRMFGDNGTRADSEPFLVILKMSKSILSLAGDPELLIRLKKVRERSSEMGLNGTLKMFNGRKLPVTEFSEMITKDLSIEVLVKQHEYDQLLEIINQKETMLYRDPRGRKRYVITSSASINDEFLDRYSVSLTLNQVDFKEGVD